MFLKRIEIDNYKSLKGVAVEPTSLAALVGPNAAGKTNFCEALDFLAHVYQWSLEEAVAYKGGYENICFRGKRGLSTDPIRFRAVMEQPRRRPRAKRVLWDHAFEFGAGQTESSLTPLSVMTEDLTYQTPQVSVSFAREEDRFQSLNSSREEDSRLVEIISERDLPESELVVRKYASLLLENTSAPLAKLQVLQLNPRNARSAGNPRPSPSLERFGDNLPAVILHLKRHHPDEYSQILAGLRNVLPDVEDLEVDFTHTRILALSVKQRGQSWPAEDLSDGTIQAIATLTAIFDPRTPLLILEEPENNVHPWALRSFAEAFREASKTKQIILTTHSPILLDQLKPEEIWIVQKPAGITKIDPLLTLDPSLKDSWERGSFTLSEYLDSGVLPEAVPAAAP